MQIGIRFCMQITVVIVGVAVSDCPAIKIADNSGTLSGQVVFVFGQVTLFIPLVFHPTLERVTGFCVGAVIELGFPQATCIVVYTGRGTPHSIGDGLQQPFVAIGAGLI